MSVTGANGPGTEARRAWHSRQPQPVGRHHGDVPARPPSVPLGSRHLREPPAAVVAEPPGRLLRRPPPPLMLDEPRPRRIEAPFLQEPDADGGCHGQGRTQRTRGRMAESPVQVTCRDRAVAARQGWRLLSGDLHDECGVPVRQRGPRRRGSPRSATASCDRRRRATRLVDVRGGGTDRVRRAP